MIIPSAISGISCSNKRCTKRGRVRLSTTLTFVPCGRTSHTIARIRSLLRCDSPGICSLRGRIASTVLSWTVTIGPSTRWTVPFTISSMSSWNSAIWESRSASRSFWIMTCLAICAPMRPTISSGSSSASSSVADSSPFSRSTVTTTSAVSPYCRFAADANPDSIALNTISVSIFLSRWSESTIRSISVGFI